MNPVAPKFDQLRGVPQGALRRALVASLPERELVSALQDAVLGDTVECVLSEVRQRWSHLLAGTQRRLRTLFFSRIRNERFVVRQRYARLLREIALDASVREARKTVKILLESPHDGVRSHGWMVMRERMPATYLAALESAWDLYGGASRASELAELSAGEFLFTRRHALIVAFLESNPPVEMKGRFLRDLFLKCCVIDPQVVDEVRELDGITYVYVAARARRPVVEATAREIYRRSIGDERIGIVVWALGQLGHWVVLRQIRATSCGNETWLYKDP